MATITFKGNPVITAGDLPKVGEKAPAFKLCTADLKDAELDDFKGKVRILNIVPSFDTSVCAQSARRFSAEVATLKNTLLLNISADLPFAQKRFCDSEALHNAVFLSTMRSPSFGKVYGVEITTGPLTGLMSRAILVLDGAGKVAYAEHVPEIAHEPDYDKALAATARIEG